MKAPADESFCDRVKKEMPWRLWWEEKKLAVTEFLAKWFRIHLDL